MGIISKVFELVGRLMLFIIKEKVVVEQKAVAITDPVARPTERVCEPEPTFIFPETIEVYRKEKLRLQAELEKACTNLYHLENAEREQVRGVGQTVEAELLRRNQMENLHKQVLEAQDTVWRIKGQITPSILEKNTRRRERERYLLEGVEIVQSGWREGYSGGVPDHDYCRVVVCWQEKILLLKVNRDAVTVPTGERIEGHYCMERTGKFHSPYVEWVSSSLAQFTMEELEAVKAFQQ